ncbi:hypothetical protein ACXDF8_11530 [Mycolicibacterium sp. CBM1]
MKPNNNIDAALTPEPHRDPWADHDEPSEDTGTAGKLILGKRADKLFAAAHAAGEALRERRRQGAEGAGGDYRQAPKRGAAPRIASCATCGGYVAVDGWHRCDPTGLPWPVSRSTEGVVYSTDHLRAHARALLEAADELERRQASSR